MNALDDIHWLTSDAATPWLARAAQSDLPLHRLAAKLRIDLGVDRTRLVLQQTDLRRRAAVKFSAAPEMFFTEQLLQQATDQEVAQFKATRWAGLESSLDLCCGIGGDLIAIGAQADSAGLDRDPITLALAAANCCAHGVRPCEMLCASAENANVEQVDAWHIDPDRRVAGRRSVQPQLHDPSAAAIDLLLARNATAAIKLAPAATAPEHWRAVCEREWIESRGECRQQVLWFGEFMRQAGARRAVILPRDDGAAIRTICGAADEAPLPDRAASGDIGRYVYEPRPAVLAAGLAGVLAQTHDMRPLTIGGAYLTADKLVQDAALAAFEVREILPFDLKRLKGALRQRGVGVLEIKQRGFEKSPEHWRRKLRCRGDQQATVILARLIDGARAIIAQRVQSS